MNETLPGFPDDATLEASEQARGIHTAERFLQQQPEKARLVRDFLKAGAMSQAEIARVVQVSRNTVARMWRLMLAEGAVAVEQVKRSHAASFADITAQSLERVREIFANPAERAKVSAKDAAIIAGISHEHFNLDAGQPTSRVEIVGVTSEGELAGMLDVIEAETVETHLAGEMEGQKGGAAEIGAGDVGAECGVAGEAGAGSSSDVEAVV